MLLFNFNDFFVSDLGTDFNTYIFPILTIPFFSEIIFMYLICWQNKTYIITYLSPRKVSEPPTTTHQHDQTIHENQLKPGKIWQQLTTITTTIKPSITTHYHPEKSHNSPQSLTITTKLSTAAQYQIQNSHYDPQSPTIL